MKVKIVDDVIQRFPELRIYVREVKDVMVSEADSRLEDFKERIFDDIRSKFTLEGLKDESVFRAYRDFFWRNRTDPTKVRPAAEALIRRVLNGRPLPRINTVVDAYNLASMTTYIALAAFDIDMLDGQLIMKLADNGERFLGIGMDKPITLNGGEVVIADASKLVAIYPHRDAHYSRITLHTNNLLLVSCGVPGIPLDRLKEAVYTASDFVTRFCGGKVERVE